MPPIGPTIRHRVAGLPYTFILSYPPLTAQFELWSGQVVLNAAH